MKGTCAAVALAVSILVAGSILAADGDSLVGEWKMETQG